MAKNASDTASKIVRLFAAADDDADIPPTNIRALRPKPKAAQTASASAPGVDLSDAKKLIMTFGAGRSGKTMLQRWIVERALERGSPITLATADAARPALKVFFPEAMSPETPETVAPWLERLFTSLMRLPETVAIDFGADMTLGPTLRKVPNLAELLEKAGVAPVAFYLLTPRSLDLTVLDQMMEAGFNPRATALVLNEGVIGEEKNRITEFAQIRRNPAYRAALDRGAIEVWMPRHYGSKAIEDRGMSLHRAAMDDGRIDIWNQSQSHEWLKEMEKAFAPCITWIS